MAFQRRETDREREKQHLEYVSYSDFYLFVWFYYRTCMVIAENTVHCLKVLLNIFLHIRMLWS